MVGPAILENLEASQLSSNENRYTISTEGFHTCSDSAGGLASLE